MNDDEVLNEEKRGWLDLKLGKFASRKLLVMILTTVFFSLAMVSEDTWSMIAIGYVGTQGMVDVVKMWRETKE